MTQVCSAAQYPPMTGPDGAAGGAVPAPRCCYARLATGASWHARASGVESGLSASGTQGGRRVLSVSHASGKWPTGAVADGSASDRRPPPRRASRIQ